MALVAFALGARIVEKHFTLNRAWKGTDHGFSLAPIGLTKLVRDLRRARVALGDGEKNSINKEETPLFKMGKKLVASKDIKKEDVLIDYGNIFSLNRISADDTVEGGQSITIGNEFKTLDKLDNELLSLNLATVIRDEINHDLPLTSKLGNTSSDIVGELKLKPKKFLDLKYNFSLDNDFNTLNYNKLNTEISINNFITSFEFLEKNNIIGSESYLSNKTIFNLNNNNSIEFSTRKNKEKDLTEYYNLIYQYKNDCLTAAIEYKKDYYTDGDIKPEERLFFSLTIVPFGKTSTPSINK